MSTQNNSITRYRIVSQNRDDVLVIEDLNEKVHICCQASDIIDDENFISGFSEGDSAIINFIVGINTSINSDET